MIPIQNIYYLLCYAWDHLEMKEWVRVVGAQPAELPNLLARVFLEGTQRILKKGLIQSYVSVQQPFNGIKGKPLLTYSLNRQLPHRGKMVCDFDNYTFDVRPNRILKSTLRNLIRFNGLAPELRKTAESLYRRFIDIQEIDLSSEDFRSLNLPQDRFLYQFTLRVSALICQNLLPKENKGSFYFNDFTREPRQMARLFESFVRNFYRYHAQEFRYVGREIIHWDIPEQAQGISHRFPRMETDISLISDSRKIIIDTKYYAEPLQQHLYVSENFHSPHLYQMYSYLKNVESKDPVSQHCEGILLYPTTHTSLHEQSEISGHTFTVYTLNLNQDWEQIHQDLLDLIY